jgi:hypothetical protein
MDVNGIEVGHDTRTRETFTPDQSRYFDIVTTSVTKAILTIDNFPFIVRSTTGYFNISAGHLELAAANVLRIQLNPTTLAPRDILI